MTMSQGTRLALAAALKNNTAFTELYGALNLLPYTTAAGLLIGNAITDKIGFFGTTPIVQRAGAAQAAVSATGSTNSTPYGYTTSTQADAIVTLVNELRAALVAFGLIKGAA